METTLDGHDGQRCLHLRGELTIYAAAAVRAKLLEALSGASGLEIDLAGVTEIDTAGLQLLVAAKRDALASDVPLHMSGHSAAAVDLIDLYDLAGWFGDPLLLPAREQGAVA
jgi:anti-sigma B factor antagonist